MHIRDIGNDKALGSENIEKNTFSELFSLFEGDTANNGKNSMADKINKWIYRDKQGNSNNVEMLPTLHNINLGIRQMIKPSYLVSENIAYAELKINGYSQKYIYGQTMGDDYNYGEKQNENYKYYSNYIAVIRWGSKTDVYAYSREIYPSDAYYASQNGGDISLQVVYRIDITNNQVTDIEGVYKEQRLVINSVLNKYDSNRYRLIEELTVDNKKYKWSNRVLGEAVLNVNETDLNRNGGISKDESKYVYVGYEVNKNEIYSLLSSNTEPLYETYPTEAIVDAYHIYKRYDYSWKHTTDNGREYFRYWCVDNKNETDGKEHFSISEEKNDYAPFLGLRLRDDRTISGVVFEDSKTTDSLIKNESVGDGELGKDNNNKDENKIGGVKVDLLYKSSLKPAKLYTKSNGLYCTTNNEENINVYEIKTKVDGTYQIQGIIPGEYYIRFTYGDGTQKIYNSYSQEELGTIYSNGYKSTIINESATKVMSKENKVNNKVVEDKTALWYLYDKKYNNKAIDNLASESEEKVFEVSQLVDYRTLNNDSNFVKRSKYATTPFISIPIEFTTDKEIEQNERTGVSSYNYMSFGLIEKPKIEMKINKEITNIKLTLQNGQVLLDANPISQNIRYISNLDTIWSSTGSKNAKIELDNQYIYGATLEVTYTVTVVNNSERTYLTIDYYKYGEIDINKESKIYVSEILEYLDRYLKIKLYSDIKEGSGINNFTYNEKEENACIDISKITNTDFNEGNIDKYSYKVARNQLEENKNVEAGYYNKVYKLGTGATGYKINDAELVPKRNYNKEEEYSTKLKVVAERILSNESDDSKDELEYTSYAQISKLTVAKNAYSDPTAAPIVQANGEINWDKKDEANKEIPTDNSKIRLTPSTGIDRNMDYYIAVVVILTTIGIAIVCLKKTMKRFY